MEKLMDIDPYNRAIPKKLIGDDVFGDTYPTCSTICQKQTDCDDCPIQEAFARLIQYEQTGLTTEQIMKLKERDTAKAPKIHKNKYSDVYTCPNCALELINKDETGWFCGRHYKFCPDCGQMIKWEK